MAVPTQEKSFRLVTVNKVPERAKQLVGRMIDELKDRYDITHIANCESIEDVAKTVRQHQPNILFVASMWTPEEAQGIRQIAERERPGITTHAIPQGLQAEKGPDGVVAYLLEKVPYLLESTGA